MEKSYLQKIKEANAERMSGGIGDALKHFTNKIANAICPFHEDDLVFILASLKTIERNLSKKDPEANKIAETMLEIFTPVSMEIRVPEGVSDEEIEQIRKKIYDEK